MTIFTSAIKKHKFNEKFKSIMAKVGNFTKETLKNGAKVVGGHRVKYVSDDKSFIILLTSYGYYYGLFLVYKSDGAHIDHSKTPKQSQEHCFDTLEDAKKFWKVREYAEKEQKADTVSINEPIEKSWQELKAKHPDAVILCRKGDLYECYNEDAEVLSKVLGITLTYRGATKMACFPQNKTDIYLPKLVRAGHRVALCDPLEAPKTVKKEQKPAEAKGLNLSEPIEAKGMEAMREAFIKVCDEQGIDIDKTCIKQSKDDNSHGTLVGYKDKAQVVEVAWSRKEEGKERKYYIA